MQQQNERWMFAQFIEPESPAELFACPVCGHWSFDNFRILRETRPGTIDNAYSVYCAECDTFGPKAENTQASIEAWNLSSLTGVSGPHKDGLAFSVSI